MTTARSYRLPNGGRLVEVGTPSATGFAANDDGRWPLDDGTWIEPREFLQLDPKGEAVAMHGRRLRSSALDDYLYIEDVHFVDQGELVRTMIETGGCGRWVSRLCGREVVLDGLVLEDVHGTTQK